MSRQILAFNGSPVGSFSAESDECCWEAAPWEPIGILGGLGHRAGASFYCSLLDLCSRRYRAFRDSEYPSVFLVSVSTDGLSPDGFVNRSVLIPRVKAVFALFRRLGIGVVAVVCNSVYPHVFQLARELELQLVDLPRALTNAVLRLRAKEAVLLCSQGLRSERAYEPHFSHAGIALNYPDYSTQLFVNRSIARVMRGSRSRCAEERFIGIIEDLACDHEAVIVGCTELSVFVEAASLPVNVVDSSRILAEATLRQARSG